MNINNEQNNPRSNEQLVSGPNALLSISQEELLNATDMEPVASLPQDVDDFDNPNRVRMNVIANESGDLSDDDEEIDDEGENGGTINIEFETEDLGNQQGGSSRFEVWNMPQPTSSSSSGTTNEDENDAEGLESHSDEDDIDMESDNEPEPQHRYSDDDEDLTSEEGDEMRAEVPPAVSTNDDDQDTDTSTDDTNTDAEETAIDVGIETSGPPSTSTAGELPEITADDGANNGDNAAVSVNDGDEVDDDDESFGDDEVHDNEDIEEMVERDLHFNEEDEEEDEDEDDEEEDESTEFEDDENDIVDYVNDVDIDDDMLSEIRNNLLSPGDIEPILLPTNLQGVRIRTTAYPSIHGLTDSAPDPALPPPPMSVPALHPLLVHHSDNQLSSGAFSRFRQLGATNGTTTHLTQQPTNQASFNGATAQVPNVTAATTALTGAAALALQQQQQQQPPRSRTTRTLFVPNSGGILGRAGGFAEYLQQVGQMDVDPFAASGTTTTRILLGSSGHDSETWRFLHDQILMDMAPQANEGNENIDGTKIYTIRTPLARWMEESLVLDGPYVHDTVAALKPKILEPLEKTYDTETQLALAKKQKEEEEKKKRAEEKAASIASTLAAEAQVTTNETTSSSADTTAVQTTESQSETRPPTIIDEIQSQPVLTVQSETQQTVTHDPSIPVTPTSSSVQQQTATTAVTPHVLDVPATAVTSPIESIVTNQASPSAQNSISILDVVPDSDPVLTNNTPPVITTAEQTSLMDVNPLVPLENTDQTIPPPSTEVSNTQTTTVVPQEEPEVEWQTLVFDGREFRVPRVLEIDPSFLAALPEGMREEIITDQIRNFERQENARRAERAAAAIPSSSTSGATTNGESGTVPPTEDNIPTDVVGEMFGEINPEFIQALPAEIQEELLQERNRTRAVLAAASGTSVDVGPAEFIRTLQPHLRQQVLADMEDSQIAALPDDIALEARRLRQAMETQHSQYLQRNNFLARSQHLMTSMLTSNAHHGTRPIRMYNLRAIQEARNRGERGGTNWYSLSRGGAGAASGTANDTTGLRGRQLLDYESICCLLILLFIDDQHLNFPRLQKVLKNLCHHPPTRAWIIKALLSIMNKSTGKPEFEISSSRTTTTSTTSSPPASNSSLTSTPGAPTLVLNMASDRNRSSLFSSSTVHPTNSNQHQQLQDSQLKLINPSWLTINFDSAFGAKTNVFKIQRLGVKRGGQVQVSVHAQACPVVCRQVIDALIILAKNFPEYFLPLTNSEQQQLALPSHTTSTIVTNDQTKSSTSPEKQVSTIQQTSTVKSLSNRDISFWELLLKLDQTFSSRISSNRQSSITSSTLSSSHTSSTPTQRIISSIAQRPPLPISTPISITTNENDFESCPLAALMCMLDHPILNKNNQLMDKLFKLLSLISQSFYIHITTKKDISSSIPQATSTPLPSNAGTEQNPLTQLQPPIVNGPLTEVVDVAQVPVSDEPNPTQQQPSQSALINNKIIVSDDQVVLGKQLDLVIKALISKSCTEDGLEFATILLLNVSKINLATREKVLHLLLDGIRLLGKNVSKEIRQLHWEVQDYLSKNKSVDDEKTSEQPQHHTSDESSSSSNLFERYNNNRNITHSGSTTTLNATTTASTKQHDLQLPAMIMLTSKTANQQFLLRILKVIIQLREARKKDQLDQQHQFDQEIQVLTRRLDNLRQSLRILSTANTSTETPTTENNVDTLVHETQPIDELGQRLEHMRTRLTTFMNNSNSQHQSILQNHETIHDVQDMRRLLRQLENVVDEFNAPLSNAMTSRLNAALNDIPTNAISITNQASTTETQQPSTTTTTTDAMEIGDQNELSATKKAQLQQSKLSELLNINELWDALSDCLTALSQLPDPHAVLVLQPAVEAFFIVHATDTERETERDDKKKKDRQPNEPMAHLECSGPAASMTQPLDEPQLPTVPIVESEATNTISKPAFVSPTLVLKTPPQPAELPPDAQKFLNFARTHRTVLNQILRQSTQHLSEGPFHILTDYTNILDFDVKRKYFRHELDRLKDNMRGEDLAVHVQRQHVFEDSYRELNRRAPEDWKHRLYIVFDSEEGQDAGGLLREWYSIIAKEMFNPNYALFMINPGDRVTYMPNPLSHCNTNHISYFKFIGRIIAKAIFDNKYMDCYFTRAFYKHILGIPVRYTDMESVDLQFYKSLVLLLENDINTLGLELAFSLDVSEFGVNKTHELIPNGSNIVVTNENKHEYVRLVCQEKMIGSIRQQINAFLDGFYSIIPKSLISIFNEQELELLISGLPDIDIEDLKGNTEYHKYRPNSLQIQWFWRALRSFDKEDLAKFLQFVTGTSKVPLQGFAHLEGMNGPQKFQIHRDDRSTDRLPSAHTCFNQLDLPAYESYDKLRGMLLMAIRECAGFGFA
ncbi:unnamed protein product [Didymodactylos carnosus]|nr:unnamed protein product [Didymodactylos carnosus]CAF3846160.1 unnamed protein product [Didymodactylos carnosus]